MKNRPWAAALLFAAILILPNLAQAQPVARAAGTAAIATAPAQVVSLAVLESAGIVPCHLNVEISLDSASGADFGKTFLVPNGGRCTGDLSCASKCCTNMICVQNP